MELDQVLKNYIQYWETLSESSVAEIKNLVSPDVHFQDPFNDTRSVEHLIAILKDMFSQLENPKFKVTRVVSDELNAFIKWEFRFHPKRLYSRKTFTVIGVSELCFDQSGVLVEHVDYWDPSRQLYEELPFIGVLCRMLRQKFSVKHE